MQYTRIRGPSDADNMQRSAEEEVRLYWKYVSASKSQHGFLIRGTTSSWREVGQLVSWCSSNLMMMVLVYISSIVYLVTLCGTNKDRHRLQQTAERISKGAIWVTTDPWLFACGLFIPLPCDRRLHSTRILLSLCHQIYELFWKLRQCTCCKYCAHGNLKRHTHSFTLHILSI